jgi:hypothetical protein
VKSIMAGPTTSWVTGFLLLACAGLGGIVALEMTEGLTLAPAVTAAAQPAADPPAVLEPREFRPPPEDQFEVIATRPLFSPSRRPYVAPAEPEPDAPPSEPETVANPAQLVGVFLAEGRRAALLLPEVAGQASWVREGEEFAGWQVQRVEHDWVELRQGDRVEIVELRGDGSMGISAPLAPEPRESRVRRLRADRTAADDDEPKQDELDQLHPDDPPQSSE